jgi:plastocyanin
MRRSRPLLALAALLLCGAVTAACASSSHSTANQPSATPAASTSVAPATPAATITIKNFAFSPSTLTVAAGTTVTVHNDDSATHTVTANAKTFDTGDVAPGGTVTFKAPATAGTYPYICMIHQFMHATLVVR